MLPDILAVIAPIFLCALVGYVWVKRGQHFDTGFITALVLNIGAPCLLFSTFMELGIKLTDFGMVILATVLIMLCVVAIASLVLTLAGINLRSHLFSQAFPNVGNMGLPLCLLAFGPEGLAMALAYFMVSTLCAFTFGVALVSGRLQLRDFPRNPIFISVCLTLLFLAFEVQVPKWLLDTTGLLGNFTIPLMLVALGVSLGRFRISSLQRSVALSLLRLLTGFGVSVAITTLLGLEGAARGAVIVQSSMPVAVFSYLFAERYQQEPEEVAGTVVISTLLSFLSLPLLLWYVLPAA